MPAGESLKSGAGKMKDHEICFIMCTNNKQYAEECKYYINHLKVPEGYRAEIIAVENAVSMTAGYNEAMKKSEAKYKVYLHHDTFIINPDFIQDILTIFQSDEEIGMIGNLGVKDMPLSGIMWEGVRYGMLYEQHIYETQLLMNPVPQSIFCMDVEAIDGFIMITQYDLPWREDLFDKWDFYDASQSMEFIKEGYRVVVPYMRNAWCVHDCGFITLDSYQEEADKYIENYMDSKYAAAAVGKIDELLQKGEWDKISEWLHGDVKKINAALYTVWLLWCVCTEEERNGMRPVFAKVRSIDELMQRYDRIKFLLQRIDFGYPDDGTDALREYVRKNDVSSFELMKHIEINVVNQQKVIDLLNEDG